MYRSDTKGKNVRKEMNPPLTTSGNGLGSMDSNFTDLDRNHYVNREYKR
jgi:hypothetical protein